MTVSFQRMAGTLAVIAAFFLAGSAWSAERVALVIGNGAYERVPALSNPPSDASDVAASLARLGFSVQHITDGKYDAMRRGLLEFSKQARGSEMAVVFFAGHGMEMGGENWLIPVDAELKSDGDVEQEAIGLKNVMNVVSVASRLGLVVLDACRNNPFSSKMHHGTRTRAVERGLSRVEPIGSVLVAYAAKDGTTASDGAGRNSPFTTALLRYIETPGLEINFLFRNVRDDVIASTKRAQEPFVYGSLSREAIFLKAALPADTAAFASTPGITADEAAWKFVRESKNLDLLRRFISEYPNSPHREEAERLVKEVALRPVPKVCFMFNGQQICH